MSDSEQSRSLKDSVNAELEALDSALGKATRVVSLVPRIQELKEEAQAKLFAIENTPADFLDELSPTLRIAQDSDLKTAKSFDNAILITDESKLVYSSTSGSSSAFSAAIIDTFPSPEARPQWATDVANRFSQVADLKARKTSLPAAISGLATQLGSDFTSADESIQKAKAGLLQPHQAAGSMRNLIQQVWGELVSRARQSPGLPDKRYELKKPDHRAAVARALVPPPRSAELEYRLQSIYSVYQDLSKLSKKTPVNPLKLLHDLRTRWILELDAMRQYFSPGGPGAA